MLLPDTGDECRESTMECEQSVAHLLQIYAAKHHLKHQRERIGAKEHDSATRGMIASRQRHHLHLATEAEYEGHNSAAKPDGVAKLGSLLHVKVCKM